jgi:chemotaxis protein methyltransferase CheR
MTEKVFREFLGQIEALTGMMPPSSHCNYIRRELEKRCRSSNLTEEELLLRIKNDPAAGQELLNAATINETYFFREVRQFRILQDQVLPLLFEERKTLRLWSVSCSTGEEAVSLALLARKEQKKQARRDFTIFASDINTDVLERLKKGCFGIHSFRTDGSEYHDLLRDSSLPISGSPGGIKMNEDILNTISIHPVNLLKDSFDFLPGPVDLIFFRNTLLYMALEKRPFLLQQLAETLSPGGYMFLASSEVPFVSLPELELMENDGVYYFRKSAVPAAPPIPAIPAAPPIPALLDAAAEKNPIDEIQLFRYLTVPENSSKGAFEPYASAARKVRALLDCTDRGDFIQAQAMLDELEEEWRGTSLFLYLEGWLRYLSGEKGEAVVLFRRTLSLRSDFWPARFYHALCIKAEEPGKARRELAACLDQLENKDNESRQLYTFLLEGFNTAYFIDMCRKGIEKIGEPRLTALQGGR